MKTSLLMNSLKTRLSPWNATCILMPPSADGNSNDIVHLKCHSSFFYKHEVLYTILNPNSKSLYKIFILGQFFSRTKIPVTVLSHE